MAGAIEAQELPDVRKLADELIRAIDEARGGRLLVGACDLRLHYVDGECRYYVPAPKVGTEQDASADKRAFEPGPG